MKGTYLNVLIRMTLLSIVFWTALLGGIALSSRLLPARLFDHSKRFFHTRPWEIRLYDFLHIRAWKDYLPELGEIVGFAKDHLPEKISGKYVDRFLWETCYTETSHWICMFAGFTYPFLSLLLEDPLQYLWIFLSISSANFFLHIPFILIQRYNRPRLERLREKLNRTASCA